MFSICYKFVFRNDSKLTNNVLLLTLNEVLTVRSSKIKLRSGLPKGNVVAPSAEQLSNKNSPPNAIFLYYAFRRNIYLWRVREAILYFTTTTEKKQWLEALSGALKGFFSEYFYVLPRMIDNFFIFLTIYLSF